MAPIAADFFGWADPSQRREREARIRRLEEDYTGMVEDRLEPLIKCSFAWHDKDSNGVLDVSEPSIFFTNFVGMSSPYLQGLCEAASMSMNGFSAIEGLADDKHTSPDNMLELTRQDWPILLEEYEQHADARNRAAFTILDDQCDGR